MSNVSATDVERMTRALFIAGPLRSPSSSRFWVLLVLSAVIATAGVISDSTATVIGAMIVAPLMTPILGTALAVVLADRTNIVRSIVLVVLGALVVIAIAFLIGSLGGQLDDYSSNSQVNARIHPRLIDLLAALATGTVGAFALVRADISDTLPGVAIAISLVPPLAVVGLLLEVGRYGAAAGAGLLFATNFAAIVATGTAVLLGYRVRDAAAGADGVTLGALTGRTLLAVVLGIIVVSVPLAAGSLTVARDELLAFHARPLASEWASRYGWQVAEVSARSGTVVVTALGPPPEAAPEDLRAELDDAGLKDVNLLIRLVLGGARYCEAGAPECVTATAIDG